MAFFEDILDKIMIRLQDYELIKGECIIYQLRGILHTLISNYCFRPFACFLHN